MKIHTEGRHQRFRQRDKVDTCRLPLGMALFVADVCPVGGKVSTGQYLEGLRTQTQFFEDPLVVRAGEVGCPDFEERG